MPSNGWRAWLLVCAFSLVLFLITASTYNALGVVLPAMVQEEGWSWVQAGFGFTLLGAATGASSFIPPILIRRVGVRATLLCGTAVMAAGFFSLAETRHVAVYFLGATLCGIGYQMMALIPGTHVLAQVFKHRALPFGVYFAAAAAGGVAGPFMVFGLMHAFHDHWRMMWLAQMVIAVAMGVLCTLMVGDETRLAKASEQTDIDVLVEAARPQSGRVYRTPVDWTTRAALLTPQFYVLLAAYFGHLLIGVTVASVSVAHLTQRGFSTTVAGTMLSLEALMQGAGRAFGGALGDIVDPRYLLMLALASMAVGSLALGAAHDYPTMLIYAVGSGFGFGLTLLTVTVLLLNYYGRRNNLEIFSITCLIGAVSAFGSTIAGAMRDATSSFTATFQMFAAVVAVILLAVIFMRPPKPVYDPTDKPARLDQDQA